MASYGYRKFRARASSGPILCVVAGGTSRNCEADIRFNAVDNGNRYELVANDLNGHTGGTFTTRCAFTGHWLTETDSPNRIEIVHL